MTPPTDTPHGTEFGKVPARNPSLTPRVVVAGLENDTQTWQGEGIVRAERVGLRVRGPRLSGGALLLADRHQSRDVLARELTFGLLKASEAFRAWCKTMQLWRYVPVAVKRFGLVAQSVLIGRYLLVEPGGTLPRRRLGRTLQAWRLRIDARPMRDGVPRINVRCHVIATGPIDAIDELLDVFIRTSLFSGTTVASLRHERRNLILHASVSRRLWRFAYYDIAIGPTALLEDAARAAGLGEEWLPFPEVPRRRFRRPESRPGPSPAEGAAAGPLAEGISEDAAQVYGRGERDWDFVMPRIDDAAKAGLPLDDDLVERIAAERLEYARATYSYPDEPGAGATLDSSQKIVRSLVEIHRLVNSSDQEDAA